MVTHPWTSTTFWRIWEAAVKSMKLRLTKIVGTCRLTYEELTTILTEAEAVMNSRPLTPMDSAPTDGVQALTPGHFLISRPLQSLPERADVNDKLPLTSVGISASYFRLDCGGDGVKNISICSTATQNGGRPNEIQHQEMWFC